MNRLHGALHRSLPRCWTRTCHVSLSIARVWAVSSPHRRPQHRTPLYRGRTHSTHLSSRLRRHARAPTAPATASHLSPRRHQCASGSCVPPQARAPRAKLHLQTSRPSNGCTSNGKAGAQWLRRRRPPLPRRRCRFTAARRADPLPPSTSAAGRAMGRQPPRSPTLIHVPSAGGVWTAAAGLLTQRGRRCVSACRRGCRRRRRLRLYLCGLVLAEEGVGDGLKGRDALVRVVREHLHDQILELQVVGDRMTLR